MVIAPENTHEKTLSDKALWTFRSMFFTVINIGSDNSGENTPQEERFLCEESLLHIWQLVLGKHNVIYGETQLGSTK